MTTLLTQRENIRWSKWLKDQRLSLPPVKENPTEDDEMDANFMDSEPDFDIICNVVSLFPSEYDVVYEVEESKDDFDP